MVKNLDLDLLKLAYVLIHCFISVRDSYGVENMSLVAWIEEEDLCFHQHVHISYEVHQVRSPVDVK